MLHALGKSASISGNVIVRCWCRRVSSRGAGLGLPPFHRLCGPRLPFGRPLFFAGAATGTEASGSTIGVDGSAGTVGVASSAGTAGAGGTLGGAFLRGGLRFEIGRASCRER